MNVIPLLADLDIKELFWIGFLVITGLSWLVRQLRGGDAAPHAGPPGPRPADKPLHSEIEVFLEELTKGQGQPKPQRPQPPPLRRPPQASKAKQDKPRKPQRPTPPQPAAQSKPGKRLEDQHLPASQLGQGVRSHVSSYMAPERVTSVSDRHLDHRVDDAVKQDLGVATVQPTSATSSRHPLIELLSHPAGLRQAIILSEILQKPVALRSRH